MKVGKVTLEAADLHFLRAVALYRQFDHKCSRDMDKDKDKAVPVTGREGP
jgi:hypothetical protein